MIRPDSELHQLNGTQWSREEVWHHLSVTFDRATRLRPDLFEPYLIALVDTEQDQRTQMTIMRQALRETFATRYPNFAKRHE